MLQEFVAHNFEDPEGNPAGGEVGGVGLNVEWQNGPLWRKDLPLEGSSRLEPNGAFVETVIAAALQRIEWYQTASEGKFACEENANAIAYLRSALRVLDQRTKDRIARGVEGTHQK